MVDPAPGTPEDDLKPLVVAVDMGYGHRRPAAALAEALGVRVHSADRPPLTEASKEDVWRRSMASVGIDPAALVPGGGAES